MKKISKLVISLDTHELQAFDDEDNPVTFPLTADGGSIVKWTNVSPGGHMIRALERLLDSDRSDRHMR